MSRASTPYAGGDLLMTSPNVMRGALAGLLRCRPTGAFLNLIRKEARLLWPPRLLTLLAIAGNSRLMTASVVAYIVFWLGE
ncbi:MAG: hypothetical protein HYU27_06720 [Acidobacteria bacterium]|nr:hypothetical protein [Acidobacteriota bacterium]